MCEARAWLDRALALHRVGSVTLRTTSFYAIVFVHLVVHVCSVRGCACHISTLRVPVIEYPVDVINPPGRVFV